MDEHEKHEKILNVNIEKWIYGTIDKVQERDWEWKEAWRETYFEIGGLEESIANKGCPRKGAEALYELGRIKNTNIEYQNKTLQYVNDNLSKNGVYSFLAHRILSESEGKSQIELSDLWDNVKRCYLEALCEEPANSNNGATTVAYKLWYLKLMNA